MPIWRVLATMSNGGNMKVNSYFSIKDPDFNDLARVAIQAVENGVLAAVVINDRDHSDKIGETLYLGLNMTPHGIANEIKTIKSLYTETFVIEYQKDLLMINTNDKKIKVILANGEPVEEEIWSMLKDQTGEVQFSILKGATVTQHKVC